jgi:hypothetical protein
MMEGELHLCIRKHEFAFYSLYQQASLPVNSLGSVSIQNKLRLLGILYLIRFRRLLASNKACCLYIAVLPSARRTSNLKEKVRQGLLIGKNESTLASCTIRLLKRITET